MTDYLALAHHAARFARPPRAPAAPDGAAPLWTAAAFGLDRVPAFQQASGAIRQAVLQDCAHNVLAEAWSVECTGIRYCAAMAQWADSNDERELFERIGDDEAQHAAWLAQWLPEPPPADPFNRFIGGLLDAGTAQPLAYLLQVMLEGFGITHYQSLTTGCGDTSLASMLRQLAIDEALHYGGALLVFKPERMNAAERRFVADGAYAFLQMFRVGPQAVVAALARTVDLQSRDALTRAFGALDCEGSAAAKLARLRTLMARPGMHWLVEELDAAGIFAPCTPAQCAQQLLS
jgi:hypothetical protein